MFDRVLVTVTTIVVKAFKNVFSPQEGLYLASKIMFQILKRRKATVIMNSEEELVLRRFCQLWVLLLLLHKTFHKYLFADVLQNGYYITYRKVTGKTSAL